jgi:hypothetical protein
MNSSIILLSSSFDSWFFFKPTKDFINYCKISSRARSLKSLLLALAIVPLYKRIKFSSD